MKTANTINQINVRTKFEAASVLPVVTGSRQRRLHLENPQNELMTLVLQLCCFNISDYWLFITP